MVDTEDNARTGYEVAVNLWGILVGTSWSRFNAMVLANSIIIGMLGLILSNQKGLYGFAEFLSFMGVILTIAWFLLMRRDAAIVKFYAASARELESCLPPIKTVVYGKILVDGGIVNFHNVKRPENPCEKRPGDFELDFLECIRTDHIINSIIVIFFVIYTAIFYQAYKLSLFP